LVGVQHARVDPRPVEVKIRGQGKLKLGPAPIPATRIAACNCSIWRTRLPRAINSSSVVRGFFSVAAACSAMPILPSVNGRALTRPGCTLPAFLLGRHELTPL
jgi:hypothetical protein